MIDFSVKEKIVRMPAKEEILTFLAWRSQHQQSADITLEDSSTESHAVIDGLPSYGTVLGPWSQPNVWTHKYQFIT